MASKIYGQVSAERYEVLISKYAQFLDRLNDPSQEPVNVFDPLKPKLIEELEMLREVSKELQKKKDDEVKKAAAAEAAYKEEEAARKAAEAAKEAEEEKKE